MARIATLLTTILVFIALAVPGLAADPKVDLVDIFINRPTATTPLGNTDTLPIIQGGALKKIKPSNLGIVGPAGPAGAPGTTDYNALQNRPTLGNAAAASIGTTPGTVAAGDDMRIVAGGTALQDYSPFYYSLSYYGPIVADATYYRRDQSRRIKIGSTWYIYYTRLDSRATNDMDFTFPPVIAYATAQDELGPWTEQGVALEVGTTGAWDSAVVITPEVVLNGDQIVMFYNGRIVASGAAPNLTALGVATASTSSPGVFTKYAGNPIMAPTGVTSDYNGGRTSDCRVKQLADGSWLMTYKCRSNEVNTGGTINFRVTWARATATAIGFPFAWTQYSGNPFFGRGINGSTPNRVDGFQLDQIGGKWYGQTVESGDPYGNEPPVYGLNSHWYVSDDGISKWKPATVMEGLTSIDAHAISGATNSYGYVFGVEDGDLSYLITNQDDPNHINKMGLHLWLYKRTGNRAEDLPLLNTELLDKTKPLQIEVVQNAKKYVEVTGTSPYNLVQLDSLGRLPAVDGSQLLNVGGGSGGSMTWPNGAGIPFYTSGAAWAGSYNSTTKIPTNYVTNLSGTNTGDQDLSGLVPKTYTVNGHALSGNISVTAADVGALTAESDPKVGSTTTGNLCRGTGTQTSCTDSNTYLTPSSSLDATKLTGTAGVNTTGTAGGLSADISQSRVTGLATSLAGKLDTTAQAADSAELAGVTPTANALTLLSHTFSQMLSDIGAQAAGSYEPTITAGTTAQYLKGDKSFGTLNQAAVAGLTTADAPTFSDVKTSASGNNGFLIRNTDTSFGSTFNSVFSAGGTGNPTLIANWEIAGAQSDASKPSWGINLQINNDKMSFQRAPAGSNTFVQYVQLWSGGGLSLNTATASHTNPGAGNLSVVGTVLSANDIYTQSSSSPSTTGTVTINAATTAHYELTPTGTTTQTIAFSGNPASGKVSFVTLHVATAASGVTTLAWPTPGSTFGWIGPNAGATTLAASKQYEYACRVEPTKVWCGIAGEGY